MELREKVEKVLDKVRERLSWEGGDIELVDIEEGVVKVRLKGACAMCPFSQMTLKGLVEGLIKKEVPEVKEVVAV